MFQGIGGWERRGDERETHQHEAKCACLERLKGDRVARLDARPIYDARRVPRSPSRSVRLARRLGHFRPLRCGGRLFRQVLWVGSR